MQLKFSISRMASLIASDLFIVALLMQTDLRVGAPKTSSLIQQRVLEAAAAAFAPSQCSGGLSCQVELARTVDREVPSHCQLVRNFGRDA